MGGGANKNASFAEKMIKNRQRYMREKYTKRGNRGKEERAKVQVRQIKYERENERKARVIEIEQYQIL